MGEPHVPIVARGTTWFQGTTPVLTDAVSQEGKRASFPSTVSNSNIARRDQNDVVALLVRNVATVALRPKAMVTWAAGYRGLRVDGYSRTTAQEVAGVVDDHLPSAGVPVNDLFWLIVEGQVLVETSLADYAIDIAEGAILYAQTIAASTGVTAGRPAVWNGTFTATQTTDGTAGNILSNFFARAKTSKLTNATSAEMLVDLRRYN